jgi:electron transport complex protein RnfD
MKAPFLRTGPSTEKMMFYVFLAISIQAAIYSIYYHDMPYLLTYFLYIAFAFVLQTVYSFLSDGKFKIPTVSAGITTGLLVLSIPSKMPPVAVLTALTLSLVFCKFMIDKQALRLNPMLVARLFLMFNFPDAIQNWIKPGVVMDSITTVKPLASLAPATTIVIETVFMDSTTTATPLTFLAYGDTTFSILQIIKGTITNSADSMYTYIHGSPADALPLISILLGLFLWKSGVLDWRCPLAFVGTFFITSFLLGNPPLYSTITGSVIFAAVYIATDLRTTPKSKIGRIIAGVIAGVINAFIRKYTWWPEGIVFAFLAVNILTPTIDRIAFYCQAKRLQNYKNS